jgi:capsular polysaccharide biosynthesis protein
MIEEQIREQETGISFSDIFRILRVNWLLITICALLGLILTAVYSFAFVPERFTSKSEIMIIFYTQGSEDSDTPTIDPLLTQRLMDTMISMMKSPAILDAVIDSNTVTIPEGVTKTQIDRERSISATNTNFIVTISYTSEDPDFAQDMANAFANIILARLSERYHGDFDKLSEATEPENDSPDKIVYSIVGGIVGFIIGIGVAFILALINNAYMTKEQLELGTGITVIGVIPEFEVKEKKRI